MAGNSLTYANLLKEAAAQPPTQAQRDAANKALRLGNSLSLLNGYYGLTANQQDAFKTKYWEKAAAHNFDSGYLDTIFRNHLFIDRFGMARFKKLESPGERDALLKHNIVGTEFDKRFINEDAKGKVNNNLGMGDQFRYYRSRLSDDAKMELLKSNYLSPAEMRKVEDSKQQFINMGPDSKESSWWDKMQKRALVQGIALGEGLSSLFGSEEYIDPSGFKGEKLNQKILDDIYSKDIKRVTSQLDPSVAREYESLKLNDKQVDAEFKKECLPGSYNDKDGNPNLGIPSFAKYFQGEESFADMEAMTTDEKRKFIARKRAYEKYLPADMVSKTLEDDARDWLAENQPWLRRQWLRTKDIGITAMAYTAQGVDGVAEIARDGLDFLGAKPTVWIDGKNNIIDTTKHPILQNPFSKVHYYLDDKGHSHQVHQTEIDNTALHQLGKEANGSDIKGALGIDWLTTNPMYWNRAEQFKTLDEDEQKQYEKLGVSPYDVAYAHNDSAGILWESARMTSFGIVDGVLTLLPWGMNATGLKLVSAAGKLGKAGAAVNALGKTLQGAGALFGTSKFGQYLAATRGALGIADAYEGGAFLETLQQNYENLDKAVEDRATKEIEEMYQNDPSYRKDVEFAVQQIVPQIKATLNKQEQYRGYTEEGLKDLAYKLAKEQIISGDIQRRKEYIQDSEDYAKAQQEAIQGASNVAKNVFLTEGLKYGFINAFGHRSYLFKNPQGVTRAVSNSLKGIKEITTSAGKKRLVSKAMENLSTGQAKRFGKVLGKQAWGGAWTNGTDDMQVEAAEEINKDSYGKYLDAWRNGEAQAETYGLTDGIYSYLTGLTNAATEEHTLRAAAVGGLGSVINVLPNFTNIASLMTKEGREHFKNNFERKKVVNAEGNIVRNEDGTIKYEDTRGNWKEKASFFIQNGVLNEYYGKYQAARDQQDHVDFVNRILNDYDDFKGIERLVASNIAGDNLNNVKDAKTADFIQAINAVHMLNTLDKGKDDPSSLSSVVQEAKSTIQKAAALDLKKGQNPFTEEETKNLLGQYYSSNPEVMQSEEENINALNNISKNAKKLLEAEKAYTKAYKEVEKIERNKGISIDPRVKQTMIEQRALLGHWEERNNQMKSEIGDNSTNEMPKDPDTVVAAIGGRKNALNAAKTYDLQLRELREQYEDQESETNKAKDDLQKATEDLKKAQEAKKKASNDTEEKTADDAIAEAKKNIRVNAVIYDNLQNQSRFLQSTITSVEEKRNILQSSIDAGNVARNASQLSIVSEQKTRLTEELEKLNAKKFNKDGGVKKYYTNHPDKLSQLDSKIESTKAELQRFTDKVDAVKEKVLTADEIMSLDPITRAKMMHKDNRKLYSAEQQKEIEKLETELQQKDADALQKIQDIGSLTRRIATTKDAYSRISQSPEAAAYQYDIQETIAAQLGHDLIDYNNAELVSKGIPKIIKEYEKANKITLSDAEKSEVIYRGLRDCVTRTLNIIEKEKMLPRAAAELQRAKEWAKTLDDISAVIHTADKPEEWKKNMVTALDSVLKGAKDKADLMTQLEKIVDDTEGTETSKDVELILQGLEKLDYQRDTSMVEAKEKRKERELKQQKEREEKQRKIDEAAKEAAEKKAAEEQQKQEEKAKQEAEKKKQEEERKKNVPKDKTGPKDPEDKPGNMPSGVAPVEDNGANPEAAVAAEEAFRNEEKERTTPNYQVPADGKGLEPVTILDESDVVPIDGSTAEKTESVLWNAGVDYLMEENAEDATEDAGGIWHNQQGSPSRSTLNVTKKGNTISLDVNGKAETLKITPSEYETSTEDKDNKGKNFIASSIEKKDDGWYFKGNYEDSKESTEVKAKDDFSLDGAIKRLQGERAAEFSSIEDSIEPDRLVVDEENGTVGVASPSLDDQYKEAKADNSQVTLKEIDTTEPSLEEQNKRQEETNDKNKGCNSGNAMHRYDTPTLRDEGVEKKRVGNNPNDPMNAFYAWLDNAGVKLQNIIDFELAKILQNNPHMKIRYMVVNDQYNATNDHALGNSVMLVVEYDDKVNKGITKIHNEDNGGVIEANGKKYLIVGTLGYGKNDPERFSLYKILFNKRPSKTEELGTLLVARNKYFAEHPNERFYVEENYNTEVIPGTQIYGYRVRQRADSTKGANDAVPIVELLASKESNPHGLTLEDLIFGIQEKQGLLLNRPVDVSTLGLHDSMSNMGRVFVFAPNSAGQLFPIALRPTKYSEIKEGALKQQIDSLLMGLLSPEYTQRVAAAVALGKILYLNPKGEFFQIQRKGSFIYFLKNGVSDDHSKIDIRTATIKELREKLEQMNPIINITAKVIDDSQLLKMYNDAGALRTDVDLLGTAGSSYNVYAVDKDGKMIIPQKPLSGSSTKSEPDRKQSQVIYNHQFYTELDGQFSLNGVPVTDKDLISQLEYNKRVLDNGIEPLVRTTLWDYYVLSNGEHPEVIKINTNSKEVVVAEEDKGKALIEKYSKKQENQNKDKEAKREIKIEDATNIQNVDLGDIDNINKDSSDTTPGIDSNTPLKPVTPETPTEGPEVAPETTKEDKTSDTKTGQENKGKEEGTKELPTSTTDSKENTPPPLKRGKGVELTEFAADRNNRTAYKDLRSLAEKKFDRKFKNVKELKEFLKNHNIEVENIDTSEEGWKAWLHTIEDCR